MTKANQDIRIAAAVNMVRHWQIAEKLGMSDTYFCSKLRKELPPEEKKQIMDIIEQLAKEQPA